MNTPVAQRPTARHWKDIPQQVSPRAMSSEGRRRLTFSWVKTTVLVVTIAGLAWGAFQIVGATDERAGKNRGPVTSAPVKDVVLVTDGVLDHAWVNRMLAIPKGTELLSLDLFQLRARLLASAQVRSATITRNFPATLAVTLNERMPVARLQVQESGATRPLFVARDGFVYEGQGYDPKMVETLPWLAGVKLTRQGGAFLPLAGMELVSDLLAKAKLEAEAIYANWSRVSLARLASDGEIDIGTKDGVKVTFTTREDFFRQLANLDSILDAAKQHPEKQLQEINLAVGGQVPVVFAGEAPAKAVGGKR